MLNKSATLFIALLSGLALFEGCATRPETVPESETLPIHYGQQSQVDSRVNRMALGAESAATKPSTGDTAADSGNLQGLSLSALENLDNYRIGPEDVLEVHVFGVDELTQTVRVNSAGYISLPLIDQVKAAGLSSEELAKLIEAKLTEDYLQDPHVSIFIKEFFGQRVTIAGAVDKVGIYALRGPTTLVQALSMAGGLGKQALPEEIKIFRIVNGKKTILTFDLNKIRDGEISDPFVQANDYIIIPRSQARAFLTDSLFRDVTDFLNPFRFFMVP